MEQKLNFEGHTFDAVRVPLQGASLLVIVGKNGFLGCGYLNMDTAEKLGAAFALVTGVSSFDDMLAKDVKAVSSAAELDIPADSGTSDSMAASNPGTSMERLRSSQITPRM